MFANEMYNNFYPKPYTEFHKTEEIFARFYKYQIAEYDVEENDWT